MPIQEYFSSSYAEARPKFVDAARNGQAELVSYRLPGYSGPGGEDLAVDVARLRSANARNLFLIISGTHGVEGFAGSGCQVGFFNDQLYEALPPYTGAILIHALNPFGFAWLRRVNEDNVDLNRNFQDFTKPLRLSRDYDLCHKMLVPDDWDGPKRKEADAALSKYIADNGPRVLQAAISGGQYSHSDGLFYGGIQKSWSHRTFHQILIDHVSSDIENIAVLDLHTGLGPTGYGEQLQAMYMYYMLIEVCAERFGEFTNTRSGMRGFLKSLEAELPSEPVKEAWNNTAEQFKKMEAIMKMQGDAKLYTDCDQTSRYVAGLMLVPDMGGSTPGAPLRKKDF